MLKLPSSHTALSLIQAWALLLKSGKTKVPTILQQSEGRAFLGGKCDVCPWVVFAGLGEKLWFVEGFIRRPDVGREESQSRWTVRRKRSMRCTSIRCLVKENYKYCWSQTPNSSERPRAPACQSRNTRKVIKRSRWCIRLHLDSILLLLVSYGNNLSTRGLCRAL